MLSYLRYGAPSFAGHLKSGKISCNPKLIFNESSFPKVCEGDGKLGSLLPGADASNMHRLLDCGIPKDPACKIAHELLYDNELSIFILRKR